MSDEAATGVHWSFWVIGTVTLIYNAAGVANFVSQMDTDTVAAMPEQYRTLIEGRPAWATGAFAVAVFGGALGCLLLLLRRSAAYYVLIASLLGAVATMIHTLGMAHSDFGPVGALIGNLVQLVVTAFLVWYAKQAGSRGWTR
jgi:hypothetical protein